MALHPASVKNTFGGHFVLWVLFLPVLSLIFIPLFVSNQNIAEAEIEMVSGMKIDAKAISESTSETFTTLFITTGIMPATENFFSGSILGQASTKAQTSTKWIRGVWLLVYKAIWRLHVLASVFLVPMLALCIPSALDGFAVRARKKYRFESYNPIFFYSSMHSAVFIIGLFVFLPLAPITLSANILAALLGGLAFAVWIATANFQTGS